MILHFVGPGELPRADGTGKNLPHVPLVVEEGVSLETVFVLEGFWDSELLTLHAPVDPVLDGGVSEEIQSSDAHFRERLRI